ncbi:GNAT family N-acetyltransferase [Reichenbachiella agarivorans]|uniref:GNAT family N-acetyltransferase n=1 Tax=Reichenbachiella agarivorans TaxID=2979464 RepID=A0ABY6CUD9_9BACT|nr:GNAT family N-acetyltransferase [Reichenbachiella agarivorans]UXP33949.1 GNAT family N-acetyltransferase [Reichenbachiella agarivorans]
MKIATVPLATVWDMRHQIMYPAEPFDFVKVENDTEGEHYGIYDGDQVISVISLFFDGSRMQFRKFCTHIAYQGQGHGSQLLKYIFELAELRKVDLVWCNARVNASALYERFGMYKTDKVSYMAGFDFVIMEKPLPS